MTHLGLLILSSSQSTLVIKFKGAGNDGQALKKRTPVLYFFNIWEETRDESAIDLSCVVLLPYGPRIF